ncbi:MAG: HAD family hydrolase [bacterium]
MTIRAILFDVGGPLDTEILHEQGIDRGIIEAFASQDISVSSDALNAASEAAVKAFAPNAYAAMVWSVSRQNRDVYERAWSHFRSRDGQRAEARGGFELRPGIESLLKALQVAGLAMGLAANQPVRVIAELDRMGIGKFFSHREVSGHHGFHKPDVRLFLRACEDLGIAPADCIMVGDRVDNDIVPARLLGMATVLFRTGRHWKQLPRSPDEMPDREVVSVEELRSAILDLVARS